MAIDYDNYYPEVPFVPGTRNVPIHPYYRPQWTVPLPRWGMNKEYFHANAPFHPDMPPLTGVDGSPPECISSPTISTPDDPPRVGSEYTASTGEWTPEGLNGYFWWQRTRAGDGAFEDIPGAIGVLYVCKEEDVGQRIRVRQTVTNLWGQETAYSTQTTFIQPAAPPAAPPVADGPERRRGRRQG